MRRKSYIIVDIIHFEMLLRLREIILVAVTSLLTIDAAALVIGNAVSSVDGAESFANPGCGFAGGSWTALTPDMSTNGLNLCASSPNCTKLWSMHKFSKGYLYQDNYDYYTNHIERFVGGADIPLDANALLSISNSLLACRRNGGTCIPRFAYTWDGWGGAEPDDFEMILTHISQISAVLSQFRDVVPAVECGIIGAYGEMHTSRYAGREHQNPIIDAWLSGLPESMALLVRSPPAWMRYLEMTTSAFFGGGVETMNQSTRARMGFYNDGYLGTDYDYGTWGGGGGSESWSRNEGRTFLKGQAVPYGGEFAGVSTAYFDENVHLLDPSRFNIVAEWYDTHPSYLRTIRAYNMTIVQKLTNTFFSSSRWAFNGMPNLSEYEGADLRKFCEDHMGYRYVVRGISAAGRKNGATLSLLVENTGFGQLLFDETPEVLLVPSAGGSAIKCATTASAPFASLRGGTNGTIAISFSYPVLMDAGDYNVFLRLRAPLADETETSTPRRTIRFANANGYNPDLKANYLCSMSVNYLEDIVPDDFWFAYRIATGAVFGGRWSTDWTDSGTLRRDFLIDNPMPHDKTGSVEIEMTADICSDLDQKPSIAGFRFQSDATGNIPLPYGYSSEGWGRLYGRSFIEGEKITLRIILDSNFVSYEVDGVALRDVHDRKFLPAGGKTRATSKLSIVGASEIDDITGRLSNDGRIPTVIRVK